MCDNSSGKIAHIKMRDILPNKRIENPVHEVPCPTYASSVIPELEWYPDGVYENRTMAGPYS